VPDQIRFLCHFAAVDKVLIAIALYRHRHFTVKSRSLSAMHLRQHGHDFILPNIKYEFNKRYFIARSCFGYV